MNVFLAAWNLPNHLVPHAISELHALTDVYPELDPSTFWHASSGPAFTASMHVNPQAAAPRRYAHRDARGATFFDGTLYDSGEHFPAHDAGALAVHWRELTHCLEGQFVAVRLRQDPPSLEVINDAVGIYQVYYWTHEGTWLISNSVRLLAALTGASQFDALGTSLYARFGWAGSDRTLLDGIRVIPGAQHWRFWGDARAPKRSAYFDRASAAAHKKADFTADEIAELAHSLGAGLRSLSQHFGSMECPITGGRDSRTILGLLLANGLDATYFTEGTADSADAVIGSSLAEMFRLPHRRILSKNQALTRDWQPLMERLVSRTDGMVSLANAGFAVDNERSGGRPVHLYGIGGEIARRTWHLPSYFLKQHDRHSALHHIESTRLPGRSSLLTAAARCETRQYLQDLADQFIGEGFAPDDVPDLFYIYERVHRWAGANMRPLLPTMDVFSPFCIRPYLWAGLVAPPWRRYTGHIQYQLLKHLNRRLADHPYDTPWRPQGRAAFLGYCAVQTVQLKLQRRLRGVRRHRGLVHDWLAEERTGLLDGIMPAIRQTCLDQASSSLWDFVDRNRFEYLTSDRATAWEKRTYHSAIFDAATLFHYAQQISGVVHRRPPREEVGMGAVHYA